MEVSLSEMLLRTAAAFGAGFLLGFERERRGRPAGLRTTILACVASAIAMMVSEALFTASVTVSQRSWGPDPARLAAGILTGMGFLGGGTILRYENFVRGVTTAATIWFATVLGLAFGLGQFGLGCLGVGLALIALVPLGAAEDLIRADSYATVVIVAGPTGPSDSELRKRIEALGPVVLSFRLTAELDLQRRTLEFELRLKRPQSLELPGKVVGDLSLCPGVTLVRWC